MIMSWIWTGIAAVSILCAWLTGNGGALAGAIVSGARAGIDLAVALAGSLCLWTGIGRLMEKAGVTAALSRFLRPLLHRLFPSSRQNAALAGALSGNLCANILGLGNAATPMGIRAAKGLKTGEIASDELCRLIVLNTASIQLIPANVAAIRAGHGCQTPYDLLLPVWITSLCSAGLGLAAAWVLGRIRKP